MGPELSPKTFGHLALIGTLLIVLVIVLLFKLMEQPAIS